MGKCGKKRLTFLLFTMIVSASSLKISPQYQAYLRPNHGAVADILNVSMELISIRKIHEDDMEFTADLIIKKHWTDPRLAGVVARDTLLMHQLPLIWVPDLYILNSENARQTDDFSRTYRLKPEGQVTLSERMVCQISCSMGFAKFPFDTQVCEINIKSYGYTTIHLDMVWHGFVSQKIPVFHNEYSFVSAEQTSRTERSISGEFRILTLTITLERSGIRYLRRAILPTSIIALISYLTLLFHIRKKRSEAEERKAEEPEPSGGGLTSVQSGFVRLFVSGLMVFNLIYVGQINLLNSPSTSAITGLDVWLAAVGLIVFILFIQSLAVLMEHKPEQKSTNPQITLVGKSEKNLLYGIPIFFILFSVIYFAVYLS